MELGEQLKGEGKTQEMTDLIQKVRTILKFMSKAKAAKLVCVFPALKDLIQISVLNRFKRQNNSIDFCHIFLCRFEDWLICSWK